MRSLLAPSRTLSLLDLDIETTPFLGYQWDPIHPVPMTPDMIVERGRLLCFGARWGRSEEVHFRAEWDLGEYELIRHLWEYLDEADIVRHFNGRRFDVPRAEREFALVGLPKPSPYRQVDLWSQAVRGRWPMGKMEQVAREFEIASKIPHEGAALWVKCLAGDADARKRMQRYNERDVELLRELGDRLKDWM